MNISKILTIAALTGLIYGCGGGGSDDNSTPTPPPSGGGGGGSSSNSASSAVSSRVRGRNIIRFVYVRLGATRVVVSYKGNRQHNIEDFQGLKVQERVRLRASSRHIALGCCMWRGR